MQLKYDCTQMPLCYALHSIVMLEVNLHSTREANKFAHQLLLLQKLKVSLFKHNSTSIAIWHYVISVYIYG